MSVESKSDVEQFLTLQEKSELELRAIAEGMGLKPSESKSDLIDQILELGTTRQSPLIAQALPLRTRDNDAKPLDAAIKAFRGWRKLIFQTKGNRREFQLLNGKGKTYTANLKYIRCSEKTLLHILTEGWVLPLEHHNDIIALLKQQPGQFTTNIIQKPDGQGNSWLMLHIEPKAA